MESTALGKRKDSPVSEQEHRASEFSDRVNTELRDLELQKQAIVNGSSLAFNQRRKVLEAEREEAIARADSYRQWQISAVEALFEYQKEECNTLYEDGVEEAKQNMLKEVDRQIQELKDSESQDSSKQQVENRPTTRSLKTKLKAVEEDTASDEAGGLPGSDLSSSGPRIVPALDQTDIFRDIKSVYTDWTRRAAEQQVLSKSFLMPAKIDKGKFYYREHMFAVGDSVSVWSTLTKKRFSGVIAALAPTEVVLRLPDNSLARIALTHIRHGRCVFSPKASAP